MEHVVFLGKQERSSGLYPKEMSLSRSYRAKLFKNILLKTVNMAPFNLSSKSTSIQKQTAYVQHAIRF
jgi:hypothetical protein